MKNVEIQLNNRIVVPSIILFMVKRVLLCHLNIYRERFVFLTRAMPKSGVWGGLKD